MFDTNILRYGFINVVNHSVAGGGGSNIGPQVGLAPGQLGAGFWRDDATVFANTTVGTVFGGHFRYVRLAAAAAVPIIGQILFWDTSVADNLFQVTTAESGTTPGALWRAGIVLSAGVTPGNYTIIQDCGPTYVKMRAVLTEVPSGAGCAVYCAAAGAGADLGFADVLASPNPATLSDVSLLQNRYLGAAIDLPTNGGLKLTNINLMNQRG